MACLRKLKITFASPAASSGVRDQAQFFSAAAKAKAEERIALIKKLHGTDLLIESVEGIPLPPDLDRKDALSVNKVLTAWSLSRAKALDVNGVYVGMVRDLKRLRVVTAGNARTNGLFTKDNEKELLRILIAGLKASDNDRALLDGVAYVAETQNKRPLLKKMLQERDGLRAEMDRLRQARRQPASRPSDAVTASRR